jgi:hypothetical protein
MAAHRRLDRCRDDHCGGGLCSPLESINEIFGRLKAGEIYGCVVLGVGDQAEGQL